MKKLLPSFLRILMLGLLTLSLGGCVTEDVYDNTAKGNFDALWHILDEHYCFFPDKAKDFGLDWNNEYAYYSKEITPTMTDEQLFEVCAKMLRQLRDGHVNLSSSFDVARFWDWYENYPSNFNDSIQRLYLGTDYYISAGMKYRIFSDNVGYIYCGSFDQDLGSGNLSAIFSKLAICNGLIIDVRNNEGGLMTSAQALAECFTNEKLVGGYISHKTGAGHDDLSSPRSIDLYPAKGVRWQKKVVVLTNRRCYSAANSFVMFMKACPNVTVMGARTGGGGGLPFSSELPNGWSLRFSACPMYSTKMECVESGIDPDIAVAMTYADMSHNRDTMIEAARNWLTSSH